MVNNEMVYPNYEAGIYISNSSPLLNNLMVISNCTWKDGGGLYIANYSFPIIINTLIRSNYPKGIYCTNSSSPALINTTITQNHHAIMSSYSGAGIYLDDSYPKIRNSIIWGNENNADLVAVNNNSTFSCYHSLVGGITKTDDHGNLNGDINPCLKNDFTLHKLSICIDRGSRNNIDVGLDTTKDLAANTRIQGANIDMGCYESGYLRNAAKILFVNKNAPANGDGTTWATAKTDLSEALLEARLSTTVEEIWVAQGEYEPGRIILAPVDSLRPLTPDNKAFILTKGIKLYGGFPANANDIDNAPSSPSSPMSLLSLEDARNTRNWIANPTVLNGKDSANHVLIAVNNMDTACIDGFTITGGNANGTVTKIIDGQNVSPAQGGGMAVYFSTIKVKNTIIQKDSARSAGGGIYSQSSSLSLENVTIDSNTCININGTGKGGGGIYAENSSLNLNAVTVSNNTSIGEGGGLYLQNTLIKAAPLGGKVANNYANNGGGIYMLGKSALMNMYVSQNVAFGDGGGIYNDKILPNDLNLPAMENIAVINNTAYIYGGGIYNYFIGYDTLSFVNLTLCSNTANGSQNAVIYNDRNVYNYHLQIKNTIIADNTIVQNDPNVSYFNSYYERWGATTTPPGNNFGYNYQPAFIDPANGNYRLSISSALVNKGDNAYLSPSNQYDLDGNLRILNGIVDLGAYEAKLMPDSAGVIYVNKNAPSTSIQSGESWKNAIRELADALIFAKNATGIKEIWVATGTYYPHYKAAEIDVSGHLTTDRHKAFVMVEGISVYGGFNGTEKKLSERKLKDNQTTLSGNIDNCYHVVIYSGYGHCLTDYPTPMSPPTFLDGVIIEGGNANGSSSQNIYVNGGLVKTYCGGGVYNRLNNKFDYTMGLSLVYYIGQGLCLNHVIIRSNFANYGGGIYNDSTITIYYWQDNPTYRFNDFYIYNSLLYNNKAFVGGAIYNDMYNAMMMSGCTVVKNKVSGNGGGIYDAGGSLYECDIIKYNDNGNLVFDNQYLRDYSSIGWSLIEGETWYSDVDTGIYTSTCWYNRYGNLNGSDDPLFEDTAANNYHLKPISPCINIVPATDSVLDLDGNPRNYHHFVDMGAYERIVCPDSMGRIYVNKNIATGDGTGRDWANAVSDLSFPMISAQFDHSIKEIWTAAGTYYPFMCNLTIGWSPSANPGINRAAARSFILPEGVKIYGNFAGTETSISQRNFNNPPSILSADYHKYDDIHVVLSSDNTNATLLDGFTITGGSFPSPHITYYTYYLYGFEDKSFVSCPNGECIDPTCGGGIYNFHSQAVYKNLRINNNKTVQKGGGMYNDSSAVTLDNVRFESNSADLGGAIYNNASIVTMNNLLVLDNTASEGGGIHNANSPMVLTNSSIQTNHALPNGYLRGGTGGGIYGGYMSLNNVDISFNDAYYAGGGMFVFDSSTLNAVTINSNQSQGNGGGIYLFGSNTTISNAVITNNSAWNGGGIYNQESTSEINNSQITNNYAENGGGGILNSESKPRLYSTDISSNYANNLGGGIYNYASSPILNTVNISNNRAYNDGGGLYNEAHSSPVFTNTDIFGNNAHRDGGGILNLQSHFELSGVTIRENSADKNGGGIYVNDLGGMDIFNIRIFQNTAGVYGGGIYNIQDNFRLINVLLTGNDAWEGGCVYTFGSCDMINVTAAENTDQKSDIQCVTNWGKLNIHNSIFSGNRTSASYNLKNVVIDYSLIENFTTPGAPNFNLDGKLSPDFVNPGPNPNQGGDYQLNSTSICLDAGNNGYIYMVQKQYQPDLAGNQRIFGASIDVGAYEEQSHVPPIVASPNAAGVLFVKQGGAGTMDGSNWANAFPDFALALQEASKNNSNITQIWVADGVYSPSKTNSPYIPFVLPDKVAIYGGFPANAKTVSQEGTDWQLQIYPNPTASGQQVTVALENGNLLYDNSVSLKLFSIEGSLLFSSNFSTGKFKIDVPQLAAGIYIIQLQTETGQTYTGKLVVK